MMKKDNIETMGVPEDAEEVLMELRGSRSSDDAAVFRFPQGGFRDRPFPGHLKVQV